MSTLNPEQLQAVTADQKQVLIIAGAGSGKTSVLVNRVAFLLQQKAVAPWEILALTFTNKAAREMRDRIEALTGLTTSGLWMGTFHSICARILRMEAGDSYYNSRFVIYDSADSRGLVKKLIAAAGLDDKKYPPGELQSLISEQKNRLVTPDQFLAQASAGSWDESAGKVYAAYQKQLKDNDALDFDDLLLEAHKLLSRNSEVRERYQKRFKHILVDEYQDTNRCQYLLIKLLAGKNGSLFVVGDPDQSIYGWRGADIRNILDFEKDYPACATFKLVRNYRSTQNILDAANTLIANNTQRKPKDLFTENGRGDPLVCYTAPDEKTEAAYIFRNISSLQEEGYSLSDIAVLYRTHAQSLLLENESRRYGFAYRVFGGQRFYERKEIKDTLAYLRLIANPQDGESLGRIYNEPKRGIGDTSWRKLTAFAAANDISLFTALSRADEITDISAATRAKLVSLYACFIKWQGMAAAGAPLTDLLQSVWQDSGYFEAIRKDAEGENRAENLEQFYNTAAEFDAGGSESDGFADLPPLVAFLGQLALATDFDNEEEGGSYLSLMTLHSAKGLEFPIVFMSGMEEGLFPHRNSISDLSVGGIEEERRLCYVGMTRAKQKLFWSAAAKRQLWGSYNYTMPSRFIAEVPADLLQKCGQAAPAAAQKLVAGGEDKVVSGSRSFVKGELPTPKAKPQTPQGLTIGDKVMHDKFGVGVVVGAAGCGDDLTLKVAFPDYGIKELMAQYAPLKKA